MLDLLLIAILVGLVVRGWRQRPVRQVSSSAGILAGLLAGALVYSKLAFLATNSSTRSVILLLLLMAASLLCYDAAVTLGRAYEATHKSRVASDRLGTGQRLLSSVLAGLTGLLAIWLAAGMFSSVQISFFQRQLHESQLVNLTERTARLPHLFQKTANLLSPFEAPQTFVGAEPTFDDSVQVSQSFASLDHAVRQTTPSLYKVNAWGCGAHSRGTSFLIGPHSVVTSAHVIAGADRISLENNSGTYTARAILFDPQLDVAVLSAAGPLPGTPLTFRSETTYAGTIGSILGYPGGNDFKDVDAIIIQALNAKGLDIYNQSTVTRAIYALRSEVTPGDSGSPLIDSSGKVMGLVFGHSTVQNHTGYALTAEQVSDAISAAISRNSVVGNGACAP